MTNQHRQEMQITLGGAERTLRPTLEAVVNMEAELGRGLLDILVQSRNPMNGTGLAVRDVGTILFWGMWGAGLRTIERKGGGILGGGTLQVPITRDMVLDWVWQERGAGRYAEVNALAWAFANMAINVQEPEAKGEGK